MRKIVQRFLRFIELLGLAAFVTSIVAAVIALRHIIDTPQPLESILPGEARLYRWRQGHIFYKILGDKDAPPLVMLHAPDLGASAYEMRKIVGALARDYRVYALDLLGFGLSDHPSIDYTGETYIAMCHDFLAQVVGQPATLLASGLSCNYAVQVAHRYPSTCARLVLISPLELFGGTHPVKPWAVVLQRRLGRFLLYPLLTTRVALRLSMSSERLPAQERPSTSDVDYRYASTHQFGAEYAPLARLASKLNVDAAEEFDALQQPTLVIWGARALHNGLLSSKEQHLPAQTEIALIQDAGISVHEEYPAQVVANIREWSATDKHSSAGGVEKAETIPALHTPQEVEQQETVAEMPVAAQPTATNEEAEQDTGDPQQDEQDVEEKDNSQQLQAYCVKCKMKTVMLDPQPFTMKNGRAAIKGTCSVCGSGQFRIGQL
ncbi:MAG: alpha/beta fold hydrolase [Ktedonobacteraceae bacterium]